MSRIEQKQYKIQKWWQKREKVIISVLVSMLIILLSTQYFFMRFNNREAINSVERLEGKSLSNSQTYINRGQIELEIKTKQNNKSPVININGVKAGIFIENKAIIQVVENDIIEINGVGIEEKIKVEVKNLSQGIMTPYIGQIVDINNNIVVVERVKFNVR